MSDEDDETDGNGPRVIDEGEESESIAEPTEDEVMEYCEFLGLDPVAEPDLVWIAREGVVAPVPKPWKVCQDGDETFYFNFETQESLWDHPCDDQYKALLKKHRKIKAGLDGDESSEASEVDEGSNDDRSGSEERGHPESSGELSNSGKNDDGDAGSLERPRSASHGSPHSSPSNSSAAAPAVGDVRTQGAPDPAAGIGGVASPLGGSLEGPGQNPAALAPPPAGEASAEDSKSFVSEAVEEDDDGSGSADGGERAPPESETAPGLNMAELARLYSEQAGGMAMSTPRSPASSKSPLQTPRPMAGTRSPRSSSPSPSAESRGKSPSSAKSASTGSSERPPHSNPRSVADDDVIATATTQCQPSGEGGKIVEVADRDDDAVAPPLTGPEAANANAGPGVVSLASRPPAVLDQAMACGHSARSSNPSEVSEDFRSDWGVLSPPPSARSAGGREGCPDGAVATLGAACDHGLSLEVSFSMDTEGSPKGLPNSVGRGGAALPLAVAGADAIGSGLKQEEASFPKESVPTAGSARQGSPPKTWAELQADLQVLADALHGVKDIRAKQCEYLRLLKNCVKRAPAK